MVLSRCALSTTITHLMAYQCTSVITTASIVTAEEKHRMNCVRMPLLMFTMELAQLAMEVSVLML